MGILHGHVSLPRGSRIAVSFYGKLWVEMMINIPEAAVAAMVRPTVLDAKVGFFFFWGGSGGWGGE